jgi:hypothetical protein
MILLAGLLLLTAALTAPRIVVRHVRRHQRQRQLWVAIDARIALDRAQQRPARHGAAPPEPPTAPLLTVYVTGADRHTTP